MVTANNTVAENAVCWWDGWNRREKRWSSDLCAGAAEVGPFCWDCDEERSEEACIKGDSTRRGELEILDRVA
jgi:hypothetical protein